MVLLSWHVGDDRVCLSSNGASIVNTPELHGFRHFANHASDGGEHGRVVTAASDHRWFTQIAVTAAAMHTFYGAPIEAATACGAVLLVVTFLCIIPIGFIYSQVEHVSLKRVAQESEAAGASVGATDAR